MALRQIWHAHGGWLLEQVDLGESALARPVQGEENPLLQYFQSKEGGRGIWKWTHYFEIYHFFFQLYRNKPVRFRGIGIYSGGSLEVWSEYFGRKAPIDEVYIEPACQGYANDQVQIYIGDQADPSFWQTFKQEVAPLDIFIDDDRHTTQQQIVTLENLLPHLRSSRDKEMS